MYWQPRSECNTTARGARVSTAIASAELTSAAVWRALMAQPTTLRLNTSSTVAKYTNPSAVGTYVMSATHSRLGSSAWNSRRTRPLAAAPAHAAPRRSPATARGSARSPGSRPGSLAPGGWAAAGATRSTRWSRLPAPGTGT